MTTGQWEVPFEDGEMRPYLPYRWELDNVTWCEPYEFRATLTYEDYERGRSAAHFLFRGDDGKRYYMFLKDFHDIMVMGGFRGKSVSGLWNFAKRGQNFGVRLVRRDA